MNSVPDPGMEMLSSLILHLSLSQPAHMRRQELLRAVTPRPAS